MTKPGQNGPGFSRLKKVSRGSPRRHGGHGETRGGSRKSRSADWLPIVTNRLQPSAEALGNDSPKESRGPSGAAGFRIGRVIASTRQLFARAIGHGMTVIDYFLRGLTFVAILALLLAPDSWGLGLVLFSFVAVGVWSLLYPQGMLAWARMAHPGIDPLNSSLWWVPRLIGGGFLVMASLIAMSLHFR
jgi:hypothetical protein